MSDDIRVPRIPIDEIIDSVRYMLTGIEMHNGRRTIGNFRIHCDHSGVDFTHWPDWATNGKHDDEHLTKAGLGILLYHTFIHAAELAAPPAAKWENAMTHPGFAPVDELSGLLARSPAEDSPAAQPTGELEATQRCAALQARLFKYWDVMNPLQRSCLSTISPSMPVRDFERIDLDTQTAQPEAEAYLIEDVAPDGHVIGRELQWNDHCCINAERHAQGFDVRAVPLYRHLPQPDSEAQYWLVFDDENASYYLCNWLSQAEKMVEVDPTHRSIHPLHPPQPDSAQEDLEEIVNFLIGAKPFEDVWFGDEHPKRMGKWWWRSILMERINAFTHPPQPGTPVEAKEWWLSREDMENKLWRGALQQYKSVDVYLECGPMRTAYIHVREVQPVDARGDGDAHDK